MPDDIYSWHNSTVTSTLCFSRILQQLPTTRNSDCGRMYKLKIWKSPLIKDYFYCSVSDQTGSQVLNHDYN